MRRCRKRRLDRGYLKNWLSGIRYTNPIDNGNWIVKVNVSDDLKEGKEPVWKTSKIGKTWLKIFKTACVPLDAYPTFWKFLEEHTGLLAHDSAYDYYATLTMIYLTKYSVLSKNKVILTGSCFDKEIDL